MAKKQENIINEASNIHINEQENNEQEQTLEEFAKRKSRTAEGYRKVFKNYFSSTSIINCSNYSNHTQ